MVVATNNSSDMDCSQASSPFKQYRSTVQQMSSLKSSRDKAQSDAEVMEQLHTHLSLLGDSPQLKSLKESALYNRRLVAEIVSSVILFRQYKYMNLLFVTG